MNSDSPARLDLANLRFALVFAAVAWVEKVTWSEMTLYVAAYPPEKYPYKIPSDSPAAVSLATLRLALVFAAVDWVLYVTWSVTSDTAPVDPPPK